MNPMYAILEQMKHSPLRNYAGIPGLTSWMISERGPKGCVRLFECERNHSEHIIPHSHRYDFHCIVLSGTVRNVIYDVSDSQSDQFVATNLRFEKTGTYKREDETYVYASMNETTYTAGQSYEMCAHEIHSIYFSKGARVLFFEGPPETNFSKILEPVANGEHIKTFQVEPWMFKSDSNEGRK